MLRPGSPSCSRRDRVAPRLQTRNHAGTKCYKCIWALSDFANFPAKFHCTIMRTSGCPKLAWLGILCFLTLLSHIATKEGCSHNFQVAGFAAISCGPPCSVWVLPRNPGGRAPGLQTLDRQPEHFPIFHNRTTGEMAETISFHWCRSNDVFRSRATPW